MTKRMTLGAALTWFAVGSLSPGCSWIELVGSRYLKSVDLLPATDTNVVEVTPDEDAVMAGTRLEVPGSALSRRTHVTLSRGTADLSADALGPVALWEPGTVSFNSTARFSVPVTFRDGLEPEDVSVEAEGPTGEHLEVIPLFVGDGLATFEFTTLGAFQARVRRCDRSAQCGPGRACANQRCGADDGGTKDQTDGGPSQTDGGPSQTDGGPSQTDGGPSQIDGGPSQIDGGPLQIDGGWVVAFEVKSLDSAARGDLPLAMAVDPTEERVGVAYYTPTGAETVPGTPDYALNYLEYYHRTDTLTPIQTVRVVQRQVGLALQFNPSTGEPVVAYLGGEGGPDAGYPEWWLQSDAVYSQRTGGSSWTETAVARRSNEVACGNDVSESGYLVGLWPAIAFDSAGQLVFAYRDGHNAQFPQQDWNSSDVEVWQGTLGAGLTGTCANPGGLNKLAWGGHLQMVMGATQPAIVYDQMFLTAGGVGTNVIFQQRRPDGSWTPWRQLLSVQNTQTGPALAYDAQEGLGVAVVDRIKNVLSYIHSSDDGATWSAPAEEVLVTSSGVWSPSLAMHPGTHQPELAFYACSNGEGLGDASCGTQGDALVLAQRNLGSWRRATIDPEGGASPKLGFFASGKRFVVYRTPPALDSATGLPVGNSGVLKLAVER